MEMKNRKKHKTLRGKSVSTGYAVGKAFVYKDVLSRDLYYYSIDSKDVESEFARIKEVFRRVLADIKKLEKNVKKELGKGQSDIFKVHAEILKDETLLKEIEKELNSELVNAEHAVKNVFRKWANRFKTSENETIKSKADDLEDLSRRVICSFMACDMNVLENVPAGSIIVAKRLLPSDTVNLNRKNVKGIVVEQGSNVSHGAIIARSLGIPAVADIDGAVKVIKPGERLILDGGRGIVIQGPDQSQTKEYENLIRSEKKKEAALLRRVRYPARTRAGNIIKVYANVASAEDAKVAAERGCDGIGLLRVEQLYMSSKILPDGEALTKSLKDMLKPLRDKVATIRLLDIGADKNLPYMQIEEEPMPVLGLRGVRLLLKYKNLLTTQIKTAIILAKDHNIRVLVPMVTFYREMVELREVAEDCRKEAKKDSGGKVGKLKIGAMIETPAAVENVKKIAEVSDFLSIGTNDLIQYSVAAGRDNPSVSEYYEQGAKLVVKYIKRVVKAARTRSIECSVCGEMAGDMKWVQTLVDSGVKALSVSPYLIPSVKEEIKKV
jgi:phosphoenolpyruvate-protein phosphotransferase